MARARLPRQANFRVVKHSPCFHFRSRDRSLPVPPRPRKEKRNHTKASELGRRIRELREDRGLTQKELAHRLRRADSTLSRWESEGNFMTEHLWDVAKALDTSVSDLFTKGK